MDLGQFQGQEREVWVTILCSISCVYRLSWVCILETSTKLLEMPTHFWLSSLTAPFCWRSVPWTAISRQPVSSAVSCQTLSLGSFFQIALCLFSDLPFFLHFRSRRRSRVKALCLGFAPKQTKRLSAFISSSTSGLVGDLEKELLKGLEGLEVGGRVETIQTTALLKTARILSKVLVT